MVLDSSKQIRHSPVSTCSLLLLLLLVLLALLCMVFGCGAGGEELVVEFDAFCLFEGRLGWRSSEPDFRNLS
jgi:hypothetical protein